MITQNTFEHAEKIANAILCEAYVIDPDSPSPVRQRQLGKRGSVFPQDYIGTPDDVDTCYAQTECLIIGDRNTNLNVRGRTKKIVSRSVGTDMRILCSTKPIQFRPKFSSDWVARRVS